MPDIQLNAKSIVTTSATTAPAAGTSEIWSVNALSSGIRTLNSGETYALVDATIGASAVQQAEIIRVTAATAGATSITVTRGVDGTTPVAHSNPASFNIVVVSGALPLKPIPAYGEPATAYGLKGSYDKVRGVFNWDSATTRIQDQGLGNAMLSTGGMTDVLVFGDSVSAAAVSSNGVAVFDRLHAWPIAMRDQLANCGIPANGTGFVRIVDGAQYGDSRYTSTGTWINGTSYVLGNAAASTVTFSPDRGGTVLDVWYFDSTNAVFTIAIDGATSGVGFKTVTANGTAGWKYTRLYGVDIIGGFSKVVLTITTLGSGLSLSGMSVWTPNGGLIVHNVAQSGSYAAGTGPAAWADVAANDSLGKVYADVAGRKRTLTDVSSTSGSPNLTSATGNFTNNDLGKSIDQLNMNNSSNTLMFPPNSFIGAIVSGTQVTMYTGIGNKAVPVNAIATLSNQSVNIGSDPSAVHIALGLNDIYANNATDATITAAMTTIRNRYTSSDVILHMQHEFSSAVVSSARMAQWQAALYAYADAQNLPLYDWRDRVGTYANGIANGVYGDYFAHLMPSSYSSLGTGLAIILGYGNGRMQAPWIPILDNDVVPKSYIDRRKTKNIIAAATTTTETVVLKLPIPANGLSVNDIFRYSMALKPALATATTVKIRVGTTGTISDAAVVTMSVTAAATSAAIRYVEGQVGVQAIGSSATILGTGTETVGAVTASGTATATSGTFNSTVNNYVTVTVQNSVSTTTTVNTGILEWA